METVHHIEVAPQVVQSLDGIHLTPNLRFVRKIGAGTYGLIYLVEDLYTGERYATKLILREPSSNPSHQVKDPSANKKYIHEQILQYFSQPHIHASQIPLSEIAQLGKTCPYLREVALHLVVHEHRNVASIHQVWSLDDFAVAILMEYFPQGDLFTNIIDHQIFLNRPAMMKSAMLQLIDALQYCHNKSIFHCDLKPENIMVRCNPEEEKIIVSLIDFGLAMDTPLICCNACRGLSFYMAPERITNYSTNAWVRLKLDLLKFHCSPCGNNVNQTNCLYFPTHAGDIWLLGVLFINILCSRNPWPIAAIEPSANTSHKDVFQAYMIRHEKSILRSILPISLSFNRVLNAIFQLSPNERISLAELREQIIRCDFFNDNKQLLTPTHLSDDLDVIGK